MAARGKRKKRICRAFENTWKTMKGREREREKERKRERETDREEYLARQKPLVA